MQISLRPHHFLCLQGYKGLNYSNNQVHIWNDVVNKLKTNPDTDILIINKNDYLCSYCPAKFKNSDSNCSEKSVQNLDRKVSEILNITEGKKYKYSEILEKLKSITIQKHEQLCSTCYWWIKGLCRDSFAK
ncbi:DUF1284 domain-containing protein [bacterium]|nr:DUF1284 domain-containing protein [bacterium]